MNLSQVPLLDALKTRYATKKFDASRRIAAEIWEILEESLILTPSSFGLQPWQFLIVETPEIRDALRAESWGQAQVSEASHLIVFTARTGLDETDVNPWISRLAEIQGTPEAALDPLKNVINGYIASLTPAAVQEWNRRQVYIALGQFMAAAAILGVDTCPLEGLNPAGYDRVLGLENTGFATTVACVAGYRADDDRHAKLPKARFPRERLVRRI